MKRKLFPFRRLALKGGNAIWLLKKDGSISMVLHSLWWVWGNVWQGGCALAQVDLRLCQRQGNVVAKGEGKCRENEQKFGSPDIQPAHSNLHKPVGKCSQTLLCLIRSVQVDCRQRVQLLCCFKWCRCDAGRGQRLYEKVEKRQQGPSDSSCVVERKGMISPSQQAQSILALRHLPLHHDRECLPLLQRRSASQH